MLSDQSATWAHMESEMGGATFRAPAHRDFFTAIRLEVTMLVPARNSHAGDIDNRLKTLIDGLTRPANKQQMQAFEHPPEGGPTYCLLDDDALVTSLSVDIRPWFEEAARRDDAMVLAKARIVPGSDFGRSAPVNNLIFLLG